MEIRGNSPDGNVVAYRGTGTLVVLPVTIEDLVLYLYGGDFATGQRQLPLTNIVVGCFSEGQESV